MAIVAEKSPSVIREKCGTYGGYQAHRYYNETPCRLCRDADNRYSAERYAKNPEKKKASVAKYQAENPEKVKTARAKDYSENTEKYKTRNAEWRAKNVEKRKSDNVKYRAENPEKAKAWDVRYRRDNHDAVKLATRQWQIAHPDRVREGVRRRRSRRRNGEVDFHTESDVLALYGTNCHICHEPIDMEAPRRPGVTGWQRGLHMDHVIPIVNGGPDTIENVRPAHGLCNLQKNAK